MRISDWSSDVCSSDLDFSAVTNNKVWIVAVTIAIVASIETLLCLEAGDKMDPLKRYSSANTELKAQGIGNILSGLVGGLPMTSVIDRKRVVEGKRVSGREDLVGGREIKKKNKK